MNFRIASLLLATMATAAAAASTKSSKAYRIFSVDPRPKAGKSSSVSEGSDVTAKSSKTLNLPSSSTHSSKMAKDSKMVKSSAKAAKCIDQSVSMSVNTTDTTGNSSLSASLSMESKTAKSKAAKCHPMSMSVSSVSMSIETAMPTYYPTYETAMPTYYPTDATPTYYPTDVTTDEPTYAPTPVPTHAPSTRRPTQRMVCQSGNFVDPLGRDCFWYEEPNIELGCESLRDASSDVNLTNSEGKTPWDECCFCGGGTMVPEDTTFGRNLEVVDESNDVVQQMEMEAISVEGDFNGAPGDTNSIVCISGHDFVDPLGRDCSFYVPDNIEQGCDSLLGHGDMVNEFSWTNEEGLTPWTECCFCGGGTLGYEASS